MCKTTVTVEVKIAADLSHTGKSRWKSVEIDACIADGTTKTVIDMKQVPFIDSMGLETLQSLVPEFARRGADFRLTGLNDVCRDILVATRMASFLHISEDAETAVRSFR